MTWSLLKTGCAQFAFILFLSSDIVDRTHPMIDKQQRGCTVVELNFTGFTKFKILRIEPNMPDDGLKFVYSEKATKFCEISTLLLSTVHTVKSKMEISQNFVAYSEYMNFIYNLMKNLMHFFFTNIAIFI